MTKTHITLVGGQPMPSYSGIVDDHPDCIILVYSTKSERQADVIAKAVAEKLNKECRKVKFRAFDLPEIHRQLKELAGGLNPEDEVTINLTSGSKPWSILFYDYFKDRPNTKCLFIDQNNNVWDMVTNNSRKLDFVPDMNDIFALNEFKVKSHKVLDDYTDEDFNAIQKIRDLIKVNAGAFYRTTNRFSKMLYNGEYQEDPETSTYIRWDGRNKTFHCEMESSRNRNMVIKDISSPHIDKLMLNTGWFELEVAKFLSQWELAKEIWLNCEFVDAKSKNEGTQNEIDVIINTGEKLLFVECKTQVYSITDVDKFNNSVRTYGGLAAKKIFITDRPMKEEAVEKCHTAEIPFESMQRLKNDPSSVRRFFQFLTEEMSESNKK